jgi:hypothetical protein
MAVKSSELADLLQTTIEDLPKQEFEVGWDNPDYEFCRIYQKERTEIDGGTSIVRKVMLSNTGNARYRRHYDVDEPTVGDVMQSIEVPWVQLGTHYSWDKLEILRNKNTVKGFINLLAVRRLDGLWALAELIEDRAWMTPTNASDDLYPYGVPYFINMVDADSTTGGFVGQTIRYQDGSTGTVCAGLDASVNEKWKNYADVYTSINNDLLRKFRIAFMRTKFKAPIFVNDPSKGGSPTKRLYAGYTTIAELMDLADAKDDNHSGKDVLGNLRIDDGANVLINRIPAQWIPQLDGVTDPVTSDETDPIYCVDFNKFKPFVQSNYWMEETEPMYDRSQHTTFTVFLDGCHNNLVTNRRECGFVMHKAITA